MSYRTPQLVEFWAHNQHLGICMCLLNRSAIANHASSMTRLTSHGSLSTTTIPTLVPLTHPSPPAYCPPSQHCTTTTMPSTRPKVDATWHWPMRTKTRQGGWGNTCRNTMSPTQTSWKGRRCFRQDQVSKNPPLSPTTTCSGITSRCHIADSDMATKWMMWHEGRTTTTNHGHSQRRSSMMRQPPRQTKMLDNNMIMTPD
jgi:hypothetical protein